MALAGLVSVADWIASCEDLFPYADVQVDLDAYAAKLEGQAQEALGRTGWTQWSTSETPIDFQAVFGFAPNELQRICIESVRRLPPGPALILVEAPMGLGKTEAAFSIATSCLGRQGGQGLYVALPTQATSNQMFSRLADFADHLIHSGSVAYQLLHGQAILNPDFQAIRPCNVSEDSRADATVEAREWFETSKRGLLAPLAVGTVDQGLFAVLQTRHFFVRLLGMAGKVVILDEVHAYDTYTSQLLQHLVHWLGALGCTVVMLSATLPKIKRHELIQSFGAALPAAEEPYPRITVCSNGASASLAVASPSRTVQLSTLGNEPQQLARHLVDAIATGGCAACVCNTVQRAQDVFLAVRSLASGSGCEVGLLHARFPFCGRRQREQELVTKHGKLGSLGVTPNRPTKSILVATQVIEQSLDLDFDFMVTDMAPVDLVLQRAGRLHRHAAVKRPGNLSQPQLAVAVPPVSEDGIPDFGVSARVYEKYLLLRSYLCLVRSGRQVIRIPDDLESIIEDVYGENTPWSLDSRWQQALQNAADESERSHTNDEWLAGLGLIPSPDAENLLLAFNQEFPDDEDFRGRIGMTRKTQPSVRLICLHNVNGKPCLDRQGDNQFNLDSPPDRPTLLALLDQSVTVSRWAVVDHFRQAWPDPPVAWQSSPLLRHCRPLLLEDSRYRIGRLTVRLDDDLGIVFENTSHEGGLG